ncbi:hypothetical protein V8C86DRAFT_438779 [Haematococcus lacustris]
MCTGAGQQSFSWISTPIMQPGAHTWLLPFLLIVMLALMHLLLMLLVAASNACWVTRTCWCVDRCCKCRLGWKVPTDTRQQQPPLGPTCSSSSSRLPAASSCMCSWLLRSSASSSAA